MTTTHERGQNSARAETNGTGELSFAGVDAAGQVLAAVYVPAGASASVERPSIAVAVGVREVLTGDPDLPEPGHLPPGRSTLLYRGSVSGGDAMLIPVPDGPLSAAALEAHGWSNFYGGGPVTLLRSPQHALPAINAGPGFLHGTTGRPEQRYERRVNLWFAPAGTECGIHRIHPFLESHTQILGDGVMEKHAEERGGVIEAQFLAIGATGAAPFTGPLGRNVYPWHQYRAVTDSVWLALEFHPQSRRTEGITS